jgi:hypothetical protein
MQKVMNSLIDLLKAIANLPSTFWGIVVLFMSMNIAVHYNKDIGIYFAGVGSTLLGITHFQQPLPQTTTVTKTTDPESLEVKTNAGNSTNQD